VSKWSTFCAEREVKARQSGCRRDAALGACCLTQSQRACKVTEEEFDAERSSCTAYGVPTWTHPLCNVDTSALTLSLSMSRTRSASEESSRAWEHREDPQQLFHLPLARSWPAAFHNPHHHLTPCQPSGPAALLEA
jgi:hypothetical protein